MYGNYCLVMVLVCRFLHTHDNTVDINDILSYFWDHLGKCGIVDNDMMVSIYRSVISLAFKNTEYTYNKWVYVLLCRSSYSSRICKQRQR